MNSPMTNTVRRTLNCCAPWVIAAGLVVAMTAGFVPTADADEGYDLMRVITSQWVKPSIMIAVDTSKSMRKDFDGRWRDVDWQGGYTYSDWKRRNGTCQCETNEVVCVAYTCSRTAPHTECVDWQCYEWEDDDPECVDWQCDGWSDVDVCTAWDTCTNWADECIHWNSDGYCDQWENVCQNWECSEWGTETQCTGGWSCCEWETDQTCIDERCDEWETTEECVEWECSETGLGDCIQWYSPPRCKVWKVWNYVREPSRMSVVKNVLGDSVDIWTDPSFPQPDEFTGMWDIDDDRVKRFYNYEKPNHSSGHRIYYVIKYDSYQLDPGDPYALYDGDGNPNPDYFIHYPPLDLVGNSSDSVDWGLITFGKELSHNPVNVRESIDPDDNATVVASIEDYMRLKDDGGLNVDHQTPTRPAIDLAGEELNTLFGNAADCGQTYGTILITDGQSNIGNTGPPRDDMEWDRPLPPDPKDRTDPPYELCQTDAASTWSDYPPSAANTAWDQFVDFNNVGPRTWVIGVSEDVGACELNWTAFMGRTDASSPLGDSGFSIDEDPYLERDADSNIGTFDDIHGHYAYFSNSAAELKAAFESILAGMGAGDYATSAPAIAGGGTIQGNMALLASSDYPSWQGHLRSFTQQDDPDNPGHQHWVELWDTGEVMADTSNPNGGYTRKIYTWDSNLDLVEVTSDASNIATLNSLCGDCGLDAEVVDFIQGNDGSGVARPWSLGALINTTPAVVGPARHWAGGYILAHEAFEQTYAVRHTLIWVGSSDGMVHAIDSADGAEILALIPPDLLDLQVELYEQYLTAPEKSPLGQAQNPADHNYGVANSIRFADVYDSDNGEYRSMLFITEGPGGTGIHAIDVTHPYPGRTMGPETHPADPNFDSSQPFDPLWSRTHDGEAGTTATAALGLTWSVPAVAIDDITSDIGYSSMILAEGFTENTDNSQSPHILMVDPITGDIDRTHQVINQAGHLVGNQTFADNTLWQTDSERFFSDNVADEGLQLDLNGTVWSITGNNWQTKSPVFQLGAANPLYYAASVGTVPASAPTFDLFVFSAGSYYERSAAVTSSSATFVPKLVLGVREIATGTTNKRTINITDIILPEGQTGTLSDQAQPIAPPILLTPADGSALPPLALYLVYDPNGGECVGKSYILILEFDATSVFNNGQSAAYVVTTYEAGEGAAGGFAIAGDRVVASQSGVGADSEAHLVEVPDLTIPVGDQGTDNVQWWIELL
ncbi:MAG: hypothetical protein K8R59_13390 [Thermoanaerobaculales bacterium]|nr:hypothetical protein [Thermoanaerobaculales bacterium]